MERVIANLSGKVRRASLHGREFLVAPLTMLVPGVLSGSEGPLYYPPEEVSRDPSRWDHVPIVVYHPTGNDGRNVSARDPDVLQRQGVGLVLRSRANGKLSAEGWFDVEATSRVDNRVLAALLKGEPIELSTGLFLDAEPAPEGSVHNGMAYTHVARNFRPDHLAVLPDQRGACSLADGCGVFNALSHDDLRVKLQALVEGRFGAAGQSEFGPACFVVDVFDRTLIYRHGERLYEIGYATDLRNGSAELKAEAPREVTRVTSYKPVGNQGGQSMPLTDTQRKEHVDYLVSNCDCWKGENDRAVLEKLPDDNLAKLRATAEKVVAYANKPAEPVPVAQPVGNADRLTAEEREDLAFARDEKNRQKALLVERLTANVSAEHRPAKAQKLMGKSLDELKDLVDLLPPPAAPQAAQPAPYYLGMAGAPAVNAARDDTDNLLPTFNIDFDEMASPRLRRKQTA